MRNLIFTLIIMFSTLTTLSAESYLGMNNNEASSYIKNTIAFDGVKLPSSLVRVKNMTTGRLIRDEELAENDILFWRDRKGLVVAMVTFYGITVLNREYGNFNREKAIRIIRLVEDVDTQYLDMTAVFETNRGRIKASSIYLGDYCLLKRLIPYWSKRYLKVTKRTLTVYEQKYIVLCIKEESKDILRKKGLPINKLTVRLFYNLGPGNFNKYVRGKLSRSVIKSNVGKGWKKTNNAFRVFWCKKIATYNINNPVYGMYS